MIDLLELIKLYSNYASIFNQIQSFTNFIECSLPAKNYRTYPTICNTTSIAFANIFGKKDTSTSTTTNIGSGGTGGNRNSNNFQVIDYVNLEHVNTIIMINNNNGNKYYLFQSFVGIYPPVLKVMSEDEYKEYHNASKKLITPELYYYLTSAYPNEYIKNNINIEIERKSYTFKETEFILSNMISYLAYMYYYVIFYEQVWNLPYEYMINYNITTIFDQVFDIKRINDDCQFKRLIDLKMSLFQALFSCMNLVENRSDVTLDFQLMIGQVDVINIWKNYYTNETTKSYILDIIKSREINIDMKYNAIFYSDIKLNYYAFFMNDSLFEKYKIDLSRQMRCEKIKSSEINNTINNINTLYSKNKPLLTNYIKNL